MSKLIKITLGLVATTALGATAHAGCPVVQTQCVTCVAPTPPPPPSCVICDGPRTGTSTLPPLSSYFEHQARCANTVTRPHHPPVVKPPHPPVTHPPVTHPPVTHPTSYAPINTVPVVTSTYQSHQYRHESFSGSYSGLGQNERLHGTQCPVRVQSPQAHRVLGCYKVVKQWTPPKIHRPAPQQVFYRVVRPIIYVRYPVPVCVTGGCPPQPHYRSRYAS